MKRTDVILLVVSVLLFGAAIAYGAPSPVRTATPDERAERVAFNQMAERNKLVNLLFGAGKVAKGCTFELIDPSRPYVAANLGLFCPGRLTYCDAVTADCR